MIFGQDIKQGEIINHKPIILQARILSTFATVTVNTV